MTNPFDKIATQICTQMHALAETFGKLAEIQAEPAEREPEAAPAKDGEVRWEKWGFDHWRLYIGDRQIITFRATDADRARILAAYTVMDDMAAWLDRDAALDNGNGAPAMPGSHSGKRADILKAYRAAMKGGTHV